MAKPSYKIVFCGIEHFSDGREFTKPHLEAEGGSLCNVVACDVQNLVDEIKDCTVLIPMMAKVTKDLIDISTNLRMIMQFGVGIEGIDIQAASRRGIFVCNIPSEGVGNAESCAELCIFLAMSLLRDFNALRKSISNGKLGTPTGRTLFGSNAIIYGFGGMGKNLLRRLAPFQLANVSVVVREEKVSESSKQNHSVRFISHAELKTYAGTADIVFLCCSLNKDTVGIVDAEFISHLKRGCLIVNVSRGGLINYTDALEALESGQLGGLGLDVFHTEPFPPTDPILQHSKVIATPHVGGVTQISYRAMAKITAENIMRVVSGQQPENAVNLKEIAELA